MNISIIMPCYNCASTLERAVLSIINQEDWYELIMINDGSSDNTLELMYNLAKLSSKIKVINLAQNYGVAIARNIAVIHASGDILGFLDADDEHVNGIYSLTKEFLQGIPQLSAIRFGTEFRNFPNELLNNENKINTLLNTFIPNLFIKKVIFNILGGFPTNEVFKKYGGEDGVFSFLLQQFFLIGTNYKNQMLIHHWHTKVHAEKFLKLDLNDKNNHNTEVVIASQQIIEQKSTQLNQAFSNLINQDKGFIPVFKH